VDDDLVVYDELSQTAHSLSPAAALVWERCDGESTPAEIADAAGLSLDMVNQAVRELMQCGLLEQPAAYSRRETAVKMAKLGGAAFAAPLIYSVAIPSAAAAALSCQANGTTVACGAGVGSKGAQSLCCSNTCYNSSGQKTCVPATCGATGATCTTGSNCCSGSCGVKNAGLCDT
jgi:hypothetical protein